jgi:hypothetical protein
MAPEREEKINGFTREEAASTLAAIMKRYGIQPSEQQGGERRKNVPLDAPELQAKKLNAQPLRSEPVVAQKRFSQLLSPTLDFEWLPYSPETPRTASVPLSEDAHVATGDLDHFGHKPEAAQPAKEYDIFHFLIQILECSVTLHCRVAAESPADARDQVKRIPHLIEWREISAKELLRLR